MKMTDEEWNKRRKEIYRQKKEGIYESRCRKPRLSDEDRKQRELDLIAYHKNYRKNNFESLKKKKQEYMDKIKEEGIIAYGGKCSCCGETIREFLTLEHLNGRNIDDKRVTGKKMWLLAKSLNYPEDYTVLCFNCNCAKGAFGICPHERKRRLLNEKGVNN